MPPKRKGKKRSRPETVPEDELTEDQQEEIISCFQHALNGDKTVLSIPEAKKCLKRLGLETKSEELTDFLGDDKHGNMDETRFLRFAATKRIQVDKALLAFDLIDEGGKGVVVVEDLERVAQELGEEISRDDLEEMVIFADRQLDGLLTPQDFIRLARKTNL